MRTPPKTLDEPGLPRPLMEDPRGVQRPVPWTQGYKEWGDVDRLRVEKTRRQSLCLVCGDEVTSGVVLWDQTHMPYEPGNDPECFTVEHLQPGEVNVFGPTYGKFPIADGGCLHERCAKITRAHCRTIRERMQRGDMIQLPYRKELP